MADNARRAAADALVRMHRGGYSHLAAKEALASPALSARDRAFAAAVFYGTAERLATLDYILTPFLTKGGGQNGRQKAKKNPVEKLDPEVRAVLETALYQLHYMRVPASAAVNEAVKLARAYGKKSAAGMVNAVLRRAAGVSPETLAFADEPTRVEVMGSFSPAVAACLMAEFPDEYNAFIEASFRQPKAHLRANTLRVSPAELAETLGRAGITAHAAQPEGCVEAQSLAGLAEGPLFEKGLYHVQGAASQFLCANVAEAAKTAGGQNARVLDLCAAPGGKSATIAEILNRSATDGICGTRVPVSNCRIDPGDACGSGRIAFTVCDVNPARLALAEKLFQRLGLSGGAAGPSSGTGSPVCTFVVNDATVPTPAFAQEPRFDAVLCDVPCSGLGVLAKKPDLRYLDGTGFDELTQIQLKILETAKNYVKTGGFLIYSTCTIRKAENEDVVRTFLRGAKGFASAAVAHIPAGACVEDKMVTILPQRTGLDGFFMAVLQKVW